MIDVTIEKVMDRPLIASSIHTILNTGIELLKKDNLKPGDHAKVKVMRTLGSHVNAAVAMIQQENAQVRASLVAERMKQLGYGNEPPAIAQPDE